MKIFDLANTRRAYILHHTCKSIGIDYGFHFHSSRQSIHQDVSQVAEIQKLASDVIDSMIPEDDIFDHIKHSDFLLVNSFIHSKEIDPKFQNLMNMFKGRFINIDYAWDTYKKDIPISNKQFKYKYSGIAIAADYTSSTIKPVFKWSQPELDMSVHLNDIHDHLYKYDNKLYDGSFLLTPGRNFDKSAILQECIKSIRKYCKNPFIYLKFKSKDDLSAVRHGKRTLRSLGVDYHISNESHKGLINYCVGYALKCNAHINLDPQSFSNVEVIRAGVPSFEYSLKDGLTIPKYYRNILKRFWTKESIDDIYGNIDLSKNKRASLSVAPLYCGKMLIQNLMEIK